MSKKVKKALDQNEINTLANIQSLIDELLQMQNGGGEMAEIEEPAMKEESEMNYEEKPEDEERAEKGLETTPSDSATASDDAEERIDEPQTELSEANVQEVAKMLLAMGKKNTVKKSKSDGLTDAITALAQVQKASLERMATVEKTLEGILDGLGITQQIQAAEKVQKSKPVTTSDIDNEAFVKVLKDAFSGKEQTTNYVASNGDKVHKNLRNVNVLKGMLGNRFSHSLDKIKRNEV